MKILIVAQNASSRFGGESFLPLKYFQILRRHGHAVRLIAHNRNREDLSAVLGPDIEFVHFIPDTRLHLAIWWIGERLPKRGFAPLVEILMGLVNEHFQKSIIYSLVQAGEVDVIHQPIPVSPRAPSAIHGYGVPVVIGPMNGNMTYPEGYEDYEPAWERRMVGFSRLLSGFANRLVPGKRRAAALLVANRRTRDGLPLRDHPRVIEMVENGVDFSVWQRGKRAPKGSGSFRLVFVGRLIALKALDMTLAAVARARGEGINVRLDIFGDGPEMGSLTALSQKLGLEEAVSFYGFRPQAELAQHLEGADALILNSLRECGGAVVLEAMSLGLPVIAANWGGPADYIDASCGLLVHPVPRGSFVPRLATAILTLASDPKLACRMGEAGAARVRTAFDWEGKVDQMVKIYEQVISETRQ